MPNRDGTGPNGQGPLTGRGAGPCETERKWGRSRRSFPGFRRLRNGLCGWRFGRRFRRGSVDE